ncbi:MULTISPECIES: flagellin [unclassified Cryobacterium]|uniref:flagellin N-terminal helical domain-containing protein n=1 Tax=unclassified Cryobacterium TaxID=2649013 RepID=UPI0010692EC3|nr:MULTISPECIES: flagellin [unclassified Cryobacterium]TFD03503.1 flagellin [Cryobacterium sp. TMT1-66-1]TFD12766.1 flagellin [Cryobacterium sp. TMT1-2-2]
MGMQVNTNVAANNAYRNLATTQNDLSKSLEKLSSGLRINRAADDAAGLAISEGLKSQVGGLTVAARNAQDAVSVIQTAEGSLNEVQSILQRVRDLAVQAGNDSNNTESRGAIKTEVTALTAELTRISESTNFNGTQLLDGSEAELSFQVGANGDASSQIKVKLDGANVSDVTKAIGSGNVGTSFVLATTTPATSVAFKIDGTAVTVTGTVAVGGDGKTAADAVASLNANTSFSEKLVASLDENGKLNVKSLTGGVVTEASSTALAEQSVQSKIGGLDFSSAEGAAAAITSLDRQISGISTARASLGADQNRFESVIKNLAVSKENLTAAGSRIRDTDMAEEMVKYTRANILSQAGTAMLAQANQSNSGVLQLLQ